MRFVNSQKEVIATLKNPSKHSATERKRAYMFLFVYVLTFIAFLSNYFHFISGWIACIVLEIVQLILALIYAFNINDYTEKNVSAMECERSCNPLLDGYIAIRIMQIVQAFVSGSYVVPLLFSLCLAYVLWRAKKGSLYVDATNLWREMSNFEKESYIIIGLEVTMVIIIMIVMVFAIIGKYSD